MANDGLRAAGQGAYLLIRITVENLTARESGRRSVFPPMEVRVKGSLFVATALVAVAGPAVAQTPSFCSNYPQTVGSGDWQASRVFYSNGRLSYVTDSAGNRIPDYSYAGYGYGAKNLPSIPTVTTL